MICKHLQQSHADMLQIMQNTCGLDSDPKLETKSSKINQLCLETRELEFNLGSFSEIPCLINAVIYLQSFRGGQSKLRNIAQ